MVWKPTQKPGDSPITMEVQVLASDETIVQHRLEQQLRPGALCGAEPEPGGKAGLVPQEEEGSQTPGSDCKQGCPGWD